jgi:hypothetical protein
VALPASGSGIRSAVTTRTTRHEVAIAGLVRCARLPRLHVIN